MEKKTIGKFISALRKANGMTQKELGEKLFVSDKTVSRWERDESTPELSLIPSIAEIFGITTDELLRGERTNPERGGTEFEENALKQKAKSDRQFKLMLDRKKRRYNNLTLIAVGLSVLGLLSAVVANSGFSRGLIAFCLATAFFVGSEISQICFAINARIVTDDEDDTYTRRIQEANTKAVKTAVLITFGNILLFVFCLPLVVLIDGANYGLRFDEWFVIGALFVGITFVFCYILYTLFVWEFLCNRGLTVLDEEQRCEMQRKKKLLAKTVTVSTAVAVVIWVVGFVFDSVGWSYLLSKAERKFDNCEDFKTFMERDYDNWYREGYSYIDENGNPAFVDGAGNIVIESVVSIDKADFENWYGEGYGYVDENGDVVIDIPGSVSSEDEGSEDNSQEDLFPMKVYETIRNSKGEVICEFYYNPDLYYEIVFDELSDDRMPVKVVTCRELHEANLILLRVESVLLFLIAADFVAAAVIYLIKAFGDKKKV